MLVNMISKKQFRGMQPDELRDARTIMQLTQSEAAKRYGVSLRGYKNYELGQRPIPETIRILTGYLLKDFKKI